MSSSPGEYRIEVRRAMPDEATSIASVLHEAFSEYRSLYTAEAFATTVPASAELERRWSEGPVWIALKDERVVGTVSAVGKTDVLYIRSMAVVPNARGQRIGQMLLAEVESFARTGKFRRLILNTTPFLAGAIRLYEQSDFKRISDGPHDLAGTPLFAMAKEL